MLCVGLDPDPARYPTLLDGAPDATERFCREIVDAHRKRAMTTEGRVTRVDDPVEAHTEIYAKWVQRLLATSQVREVDGHSIALRPSSIPGFILRSWAAWFH